MFYTDNHYRTGYFVYDYLHSCFLCLKGILLFVVLQARLPHCPLPAGSDVLLIVKDLEKGLKVGHFFCNTATAHRQFCVFLRDPRIQNPKLRIRPDSGPNWTYFVATKKICCLIALSNSRSTSINIKKYWNFLYRNSLKSWINSHNKKSWTGSVIRNYVAGSRGQLMVTDPMDADPDP